LDDPGSSPKVRRLRMGARGWTWLIVIVAAVVLWVLWPHPANHLGVSPEHMGAIPVAGGDFQLSDGSGPWRLSAHATAQTIVLLYFGFTHCPDRCPLTLQRLARAIAALPAEQRERVMVVFVSVDYRSDTPASAAAYAKNFGPEFVGLSGDSTTIERMTRRFNAAYAFVPLVDSAMPYTVDHTGIVYVLDSKGSVKSQWELDKRNFDLAAALKAQL
jgi:protein SCO1/2